MLWCLAARGRSLIGDCWLLFLNFTSFFASIGLLSCDWSLGYDTTLGIGDEKLVEVEEVVDEVAVLLTGGTIDEVETLDEATDGCTLAEAAWKSADLRLSNEPHLCSSFSSVILRVAMSVG